MDRHFGATSFEKNTLYFWSKASIFLKADFLINHLRRKQRGINLRILLSVSPQAAGNTTRSD
jgi:hypothetical protein